MAIKLLTTWAMRILSLIAIIAFMIGVIGASLWTHNEYRTSQIIRLEHEARVAPFDSYLLYKSVDHVDVEGNPISWWCVGEKQYMVSDRVYLKSFPKIRWTEILFKQREDGEWVRTAYEATSSGAGKPVGDKGLTNPWQLGIVMPYDFLGKTVRIRHDMTIIGSVGERKHTSIWSDPVTVTECVK